jgi:beta-lactamase regulating signal transducer with metallopeptidase domain
MNQLTIWLSQAWVERLGWTLVYFIWQGAAIALLLAIARVWVRSPRARHAAACVSLAAMTIAPAITFALLQPIGVARTDLAATVSPHVQWNVAVPAGVVSPGLLSWVVMVWMAGIAVLSVRLAVGWISAARVRTAQSRPAPPEWEQALARLALRMGITRRVRLLVSPRVDVPAVLGWLRPVVLAPVAALGGLPAEHMEALLAHELAHIRRHDYLINVLQGIVETVLFYHPAVWWVSLQIRDERELCCDDLAVAATSDVLTYARALAELEACRPSGVQTAIAANGGSLLQRIARLLEPGRAQHTLPRASAVWMVAAVLAIGIGALAMHATAQETGTPTVSRDDIWTDTVRRGDMLVEVRGLGKLVSPNVAELRIAETQMRDVRLGMSAKIDYRGPQVLDGQVTAISPQAVNGTVGVTVTTSGLPSTAGRPPLDVDGTILITTLPNVIMVGRPIFAGTDTKVMIFRLEPGSDQAVRVPVTFGRMSVNTIEVRSGLSVGDKIILSDMSKYDGPSHIKLK